MGQIPFRLDWIKGELRASVEGLRAVYVEGDSMSPTINPGDQILVNTNASTDYWDGIHLVRLGETLLVKRLQRTLGGGLKIKSDNPAYDEMTLEGSNPPEDFAVIGRVVWHGKWV